MPTKIIIKDELDDLFSNLEDNPEFQEAQADLDPGYQITYHRLSKGLTQGELAELAGTSQSSIARLENSTKPPSLSFLRRVAKALDASVEVKITANTNKNSEGDDRRVLMDSISFLHEGAYEDLRQGKFFEAHKKYESLLKFMEKQQVSQEFNLLSVILRREISLCDQLAESNHASAVKESNFQAEVRSLRNHMDDFIEHLNADQSRRQHASERASMANLAFQQDSIPSSKDVYAEFKRSDQA
jgi:transcriptional regulator with XRE-family HTH domain